MTEIEFILWDLLLVERAVVNQESDLAEDLTLLAQLLGGVGEVL